MGAGSVLRSPRCGRDCTPRSCADAVSGMVESLVLVEPRLLSFEAAMEPLAAAIPLGMVLSQSTFAVDRHHLAVASRGAGRWVQPASQASSSTPSYAWSIGAG